MAREDTGYTYQVQWNMGWGDTSQPTITSTIRYQEVPEVQLPSQAPTCDSTSFNDGTWADFSPIAQQVTSLRHLQVPTSWLAAERSATDTVRVYLPYVAGPPSQGFAVRTYTLDLSDGNTFRDGGVYYLCIGQTDGTSPGTFTASTAPVIRVPKSPYFGPD